MRLLKAFPELLTMVKAMTKAISALSATLTMLLALVYVYSIMLSILLKDEPELDFYFATFPRTMWTLLIDGTLLDGTGNLMKALFNVGSFSSSISALVFMSFLFLSAVTLMNMLIGVLCDVVCEVSAYEK